MNTPYLLIMIGDIEPELRGPFDSEETRDQAAVAHRRQHGLDDGVFAVDVDWDARELDFWAYAAGEFMDEHEERDKEGEA